MTEKKITKRDMFNEIIKMMNGEQMSVSSQAVIDFANHEIELLNKKSSSSSGKQTKTQLENESYKEIILERFLFQKHSHIQNVSLVVCRIVLSFCAIW